MIAALDAMQEVAWLHFATNALQEIQRTKRIVGALHEQDRRSQSAQDFIAKFGPITHRAERISEANQTGDIFFE